jgi:hypothetical protein
MLPSWTSPALPRCRPVPGTGRQRGKAEGVKGEIISPLQGMQGNSVPLPAGGAGAGDWAKLLAKRLKCK